MYAGDHERISGLAKKKLAFLDTSFSGYLVLAALAGAYVGFGIALIFSLGGPLAAAGSPMLKLVMGASFGMALTLVIFAGSELFTGQYGGNHRGIVAEPYLESSASTERLGLGWQHGRFVSACLAGRAIRCVR